MSPPSSPLRSRWPAGSEVCGHCLQLYEIETERRCETCDGPVCMFCVEASAVRGALFCPQCRPRRSRRVPGGTRGMAARSRPA